MTLGRRHLRGTTQIAANAAALKNLFNGRHPPEFLPEAPGRPSKTVCKPFFQRTKGSLFCAFSDYSHQSLYWILNYNRNIITAKPAFVKNIVAGNCFPEGYFPGGICVKNALETPGSVYTFFRKHCFYGVIPAGKEEKKRRRFFEKISNNLQKIKAKRAISDPFLPYF